MRFRRNSRLLAARLGLALAACLALLAAPAAPKADEPEAVAPDIPNESADLFDLYCLKAFPDIGAMDALAQQRGDAALSAEGLPRPGKVWAVHSPSGLSIVSAMAGPPGGCSVRRMTPAGLADTAPFKRVLEGFARTYGLTLAGAQSMRLPDMEMAGMTAEDQSGRPVEGFTVSVINFHGHRPSGLADAGEDGPGVEILLGRGISSPLPVP